MLPAQLCLGVIEREYCRILERVILCRIYRESQLNFNEEVTCDCIFSPEVVQSQPYGEKADVWASGCILYQMATLQPPFYSSNMLALATKVRVTILESSPSRFPQRSGSKLDKRINDGRGLFAQNNEKGKFELSPDFVHLFLNKWTKSPNTTLPNFHPHTPEQCESHYPRQILEKEIGRASCRERV